MEEGLVIENTARMTYAQKRFIFKDGDTHGKMDKAQLDVNGQLYQLDEKDEAFLDSMGPNNYEYTQVLTDETYILNTLNR